MGYFMRYISNESANIDFGVLNEALQSIDRSYEIRMNSFGDLGELYFSGRLYANVEIDAPDDEIFEDDILSFIEMVGTPSTSQEQSVVEILQSAQLMVTIESFWEGNDPEPTLEKIDPLWDWLFTRLQGVLQVDNEGFYGADGLLVERKFMI